MNRESILLGALLAAASCFSQTPMADPQVKGGELVWFSMSTTKEQVFKALGPPAMIAPFGSDFESWQYKLGNVDHDDFSHQIVFRKSNQSLVSITRNYDPEKTVDILFPATIATVHHFPNAEKPQFSIRVRPLADGSYLMAMGISKPGQVTGQVVMMRASEVQHFYPWLSAQLPAWK